MKTIFNIIISTNIFIILFLTIKHIIENFKYIKIKLKAILEKTKFVKIIDNKLNSLIKYAKEEKNKKITAMTLVLVSVSFFIIIFVLSISTTKIVSTSIILSVISFMIPYTIISILLNSNIQKLKNILPSYIVNLKNNIEITNNIIKAISITNVQPPLRYSIDNFNYKVERGINVYQCFDELKQNINIEVFGSLIDSFKVCYKSGGDFTKVLNKYIDIVTKENMEKAKLKEDSNATILTLIVMVMINVILLFLVVLSNNEYRQVILGTTMGHVIINMQIISYLVVIYFVYKVYKMEE